MGLIVCCRYVGPISMWQQTLLVSHVETIRLQHLALEAVLIQCVGSDNLSQQQALVNYVPITKSLHQIRLVANSKLVMFQLDNSSQPMLFARHVQLIRFHLEIKRAVSKEYALQDIK